MDRLQFNSRLYDLFFVEEGNEARKIAKELNAEFSKLVTIRDALDALANKYPDVCDSEIEEFFLHFYKFQQHRLSY